MNAGTPRRRTQAIGLETATQDLPNPAMRRMARYLESKIGLPTTVSTDRKVTELLGYRWVCESGFTFPNAQPRDWSVGEIRSVVRALQYGKLKATIKTPLRLDQTRTQFAEDLRRDRANAFSNCVNLFQRKNSTPRQSATTTSPPHADDNSANSDENSNHELPLDTVDDPQKAIHACPTEKRAREEDTDSRSTQNKKSRTITENLPPSEELPEPQVSRDLAPSLHGTPASRPTLLEPWATNVKEVEDKARDLSRKGSTMICLTSTGNELTLKSFRPLLTGDEQLDCRIVDACLSMLVDTTYRQGARPKTVVFDSTFWKAYQRPRVHLGRWYDMVAPLKDMEMLLFPVCQDNQWTLFEVSGARETITYHAPVDLNTTDVIEAVLACLKTEFEIEGWAVDLRFLPRGNSGVLMLATAIQRVLQKNVEYAPEYLPGLRRWIAAVLLGMNVWELVQAFDLF